MTQEEFDEIKEMVIMMRQYVISHDILIGECVGWTRLKEKFNVGQNDKADWEKDLAWVEQRQNERWAKV